MLQNVILNDPHFFLPLLTFGSVVICSYLLFKIFQFRKVIFYIAAPHVSFDQPPLRHHASPTPKISNSSKKKKFKKIQEQYSQVILTSPPIDQAIASASAIEAVMQQILELRHQKDTAELDLKSHIHGHPSSKSK